MIVLVGKSMWSATEVAKEIGFANDQDVPVLRRLFAYALEPRLHLFLAPMP